MAFNWLSSSIGKKLGMALSGLMLYGFLIGHLAGNFLLFNNDNGQGFNAYSSFLTSHPLLVPVELGLMVVFCLHIYLSISVSLENKRARRTGYQQQHAVGGRSYASLTMPYTGVLILVFVLIHLKTFKYSDHSNLYLLVKDTFQDPVYLVGYVLAMALLGFHLWHAFQSALQTLGVFSVRLRSFGRILAVILAGGFGIIPLYLGLFLK
jgi:succinate dehydrogenase / fumarate reductase cytochrome b subunit